MSVAQPSDRESVRRTLVREFHDDIAHLLCNASLKAMSSESTSDPATLKAVLTDVAGTISLALTGLRALELLDPASGEVGEVSDRRDFTEERPPAVVCAQWHRRLSDAGFQSRFGLSLGAPRVV